MVRNNKRGIMSFNFISLIPKIIFLVIMLMACVILIRVFISSKFDTKNIQADLLISGFIYGPGGINYYDYLTGRTYPTLVDVRQLNGSELDAAFYYPLNKMIAAKVSLSTSQSRGDPALAEIYYNKEWYDNWVPLLYMKGIGGVTEYLKTIPVTYLDAGGVMKLGYVHFQVLQPTG